MANRDMPAGAYMKPLKGTARKERLERSMTRVAGEDAQKAKARARDKAACPKTHGCRFPHCPHCRRYKTLVPQAAHVIQAKGIGGDPSGIRSTADKLMLLDPLTHGQQERGEIDVVPLTDKGTDGICEFYLIEDVYDRETGNFSTMRLLWAREKAIGVPEHSFPLVKFKPARRLQEPD